MSQPYKKGDRVFVVETGHFDNDKLDWLFHSAAYGIVKEIAANSDHTAMLGEWKGPKGTGYFLDLFDKSDTRIPDGPYWFHELELVKCCTKTTSPTDSDKE